MRLLVTVGLCSLFVIPVRAEASELRPCIINHPKAVGVCPQDLVIDPLRDQLTFSIAYQAKVDSPTTSILWGKSMDNSPAKDIPRGCRAVFQMDYPASILALDAHSSLDNECDDWSASQTGPSGGFRRVAFETTRGFNASAPNANPGAFSWDITTSKNCDGVPGSGTLQAIARDATNWWTFATVDYQLVGPFSDPDLLEMTWTSAAFGGVSNTTAQCTATGDPIQVAGFPAILICADRDGDSQCDASDNCPFVYNPTQLPDTDGQGRADICTCGDSNGDGRVTVSDIVALNLCIFNPALCTDLMDANGDGLKNVQDIVAINLEIFSGNESATCKKANNEPIQPCPDSAVACP